MLTEVTPAAAAALPSLHHRFCLEFHEFHELSCLEKQRIAINLGIGIVPVHIQFVLTKLLTQQLHVGDKLPLNR